MSLFAGIISRKQRPISSSASAVIRRSLSRNSRDEIEIFEDSASLIAKVDLGAFEEPAEFVDEMGNLTLIAGEPLIDGAGGRTADTAKIHNALLRDELSALDQARGVFSVAHYRPDRGELVLATDKLGIRPIYYSVSEDFVLFASALRVLEEMREVPKVMDLRAVTETVGLGYALADRTPYTDIKLLQPAQALRVGRSTSMRSEYRRWDEIDVVDRSESELLAQLYASFGRAVADRNRGDEKTAAYLSGGLDSRCIVAALTEHNVSIHTFNFARPGTQDQVYGREFAAAIGSDHIEAPKHAGDLVPDYSSLMANVWHARTAGAKRPAIVWSGEGGSVALGHVHLSEGMVHSMRGGMVDEAVNEYMQREFAHVSPRIFKNGCGERLSTVINEGIRGELARFNCKDPARAFYFFLLLNDQHRKLTAHFENIDLHRLEFQLPFFDSSFIELIASVPVDACLRHRLYVKWLSFFPRCVAEVPWQSYPGHEPCPVARPFGLGYQWSSEYQSAERAARKERVLGQARQLIGSPRFPKKLLDKTTLRLAALAHAAGIRDYGYLIGPAHTYCEYAEKCSGIFELL